MKEQHFFVAVVIAHGLGVSYSVQIFPMRGPPLPFVSAIRDIGVIQILMVGHSYSGYSKWANFRIICHVEYILRLQSNTGSCSAPLSMSLKSFTRSYAFPG